MSKIALTEEELISVVKGTNAVVNSTNAIIRELSKNTEVMMDTIARQNDIIAERKKYKRFKFACVCFSIVLIFGTFYFLYFQSNLKMYEKYAEIVSKYERMVE